MELIGVLVRGCRILFYIGRDHMVGDDVAKEVEPEKGNLGQHSAFVRNARGQHIVEGGDAIGRDEK